MSSVAIDVDDTLYPFGLLAKEAFLKLAKDCGDKEFFKGAYAPSTEWRTPNDILGAETWMEAIELCHQPEVILSQDPFPGAVAVVNALSEYGHEIKYITNRDWKAAGATDQWLIERGFPEGELICTMEPKVPLIPDCQYLIDDRPKTLIEFVYDHDWHGRFLKYPASMKRKAFGIHAEYNRNLTDIDNIYLAPSWTGLHHYFVDKGLLSNEEIPGLSPFHELESVNG